MGNMLFRMLKKCTRDEKDISFVLNPTKENILEVCHPDDQYFSLIAHRVQNCSDLLAVKAGYHKACG